SLLTVGALDICWSPSRESPGCHPGWSKAEGRDPLSHPGQGNAWVPDSASRFRDDIPCEVTSRLVVRRAQPSAAAHHEALTRGGGVDHASSPAYSPRPQLDPVGVQLSAAPGETNDVPPEKRRAGSW